MLFTAILCYLEDNFRPGRYSRAHNECVADRNRFVMWVKGMVSEQAVDCSEMANSQQKGLPCILLRRVDKDKFCTGVIKRRTNGRSLTTLDP